MDKDNRGHTEPRLTNVIAVTDQIVPLKEGFVAEIKFIDTATGATWTELAWLDPDGTTRDGPPARLEDGMAELHRLSSSGLNGQLNLAAAREALPPRSQEAVAKRLGEAAPNGVFRLAAGPGTLAALTGDLIDLDGAAQTLLLLRTDRAESPSLSVLDLGPLLLSRVRFVTAITIHAGVLFAAVADPIGGFDLFGAAIEEGNEPRFTSRLTSGAYRFAVNAAVSAMTAHPEGLLLGTAGLAPGATALGNWGAELLLLRPGGSWEIVIGQPRFTPEGLKQSRSGQLPGLGRVANSAVKVIAAPADDLATATHLLLQDFAGRAVAARQDAVPDLLDYMGPVRFLRSTDLATWEEVPFAWTERMGAVTALAETAAGVLVGHEGLAAEGLPLTFLPHS